MLARAKGHEEVHWFLGGLLLGPLALLASIGLPDLKLRRYLRLLAEHQGAVDREEPLSPPPPGEVDADAQRRRILGLK